jgi:hypothetical protein
MRESGSLFDKERQNLQFLDSELPLGVGKHNLHSS